MLDDREYDFEYRSIFYLMRLNLQVWVAGGVEGVLMG
jgi:hypothetical protein